jgi:hypothetical protein
MPTKTSAGPNEVVRLEVLRLTPPLMCEFTSYVELYALPDRTAGSVADCLIASLTSPAGGISRPAYGLATTQKLRTK